MVVSKNLTMSLLTDLIASVALALSFPAIGTLGCEERMLQRISWLDPLIGIEHQTLLQQVQK